MGSTKTLGRAKCWLAAAAIVALTGPAQATLISLGDGTVKDTNTNLIWLQNWSFQARKGEWATQNDWAEGLDFAGGTDWRLPGYSEYIALITSYGILTKVAAFTKVQSDFYWSGTQYTPLSGCVLSVAPDSLSQNNFGCAQNQYYAVAVRTGDATPAVPEPQALALALLALGAAVAARRSRPA